MKAQDIQISFVWKLWRGDHTHYLAEISTSSLTNHFLNMKQSKTDPLASLLELNNWSQICENTPWHIFQ